MPGWSQAISILNIHCTTKLTLSPLFLLLSLQSSNTLSHHYLFTPSHVWTQIQSYFSEYSPSEASHVPEQWHYAHIHLSVACYSQPQANKPPATFRLQVARAIITRISQGGTPRRGKLRVTFFNQRRTLSYKQPGPIKAWFPI